MNSRGFLLATGAALALAACTSTSQMPTAPEFPSPVATAPLTPYVLQVGDILDLRLMLNPELNEEVTIRPDGHISTTVVPDMTAAGRTVDDLAAALRQAYGRDLRNPRVSVLVKSFAPTRIYVAGEVAAPGEFLTVGPNLSLSQALARAGGVRISGDEQSVFIIRRTATGAEYYSTRYNDVMHGRDSHADVVLAPYDVVYVPRTGIAEVYRWYNQYFENFVHPSFGFSYLVGNSGNGGAVITQPATVAPTTR